VSLKNNKISDFSTLPASWPLLQKLFLGKETPILQLYVTITVSSFVTGSNLLNTIPFEIGSCSHVVELDFSQ
jgi:hypothetical protein